MSLCGFLSQDGTYTECESWCHMSCATEIVEEKYHKILGGIQSEDYLYEQGYVIFYSRNAQHRFRSNESVKIIFLLSDKQKDFIIQNLCNANNDMQRKDMEQMLQYDADYREDFILSRMEDKMLN